jgi:crotonobetaine/carnitine-CoA ligase
MTAAASTATAQTLGEALLSAAAADPDRVLLDCGGRTTTAGELEEASARVGAALLSQGVARGDRVAIMMGNTAEFLEAWFALARQGIVEVPVHVAYKGALLQHVLAESGARVLFVDAEFVERLAGLDLPDLELIVVRGDLPGGEPQGLPAVPLAELQAHSSRAEDVALIGRDTSCILYTSGTTGPSKGVVLSHTANLHLARTVIGFMRYEPDDVLYTTFPLFHVNAKFTSVMTALLTGARLVLDQRFSASTFWDRIREKGVTAFNYMGSLLTILHKQPERPDDADNPVRRCYGAACPASIWEQVERRFGLRLREHYGMTEIGIATMNTEEGTRVGSIGRAAPYFEVRVADGGDNEVGPGEVGEIQVRPRFPDTIIDYYWNRPDATIEAFRNLWFHTGDLGSRDEDGFYYYVDRLKDSIRRRGENISSFEVESVVNTHPAVLESAAFGVPSELGEDDVMVAVVLKEGQSLSPTELLDFCQPRLAHFAVPRYVAFRDSIPKNASQRIQKFKLREEGVGDAFDRVAAGYEVRR